MDDRVKALFSDLDGAKQLAREFMDNEEEAVRFLGLRIAAALRAPQFFPSVRRLFVPTEDPGGWIRKNSRAVMELAIQVDREACLDELIALQDYSPEVHAKFGGAAGRWGGSTYEAMKLLEGASLKAPALLYVDREGGLVLSHMSFPGFYIGDVMARTKALLKQGRISQAAARHILIRLGDPSMLPVVRDWLLLLIALTEDGPAGRSHLELKRCTDYLATMRWLEPLAWLMMALRNEALVGQRQGAEEYETQAEARQFILKAVMAIGRRPFTTTSQWERWYIGNFGDKASVRAAARMKVLKRWWQGEPREGLPDLVHFPQPKGMLDEGDTQPGLLPHRIEPHGSPGD